MKRRGAMPTPEEEAAATAAAEKDATDKQAAADAAKAKTDAEAKLGDAGKAALDVERKARRDAEKAARDAQAKLDTLEAEKLSDTEKLEKRATDAEAKVTAATEKLRRANLLSALADAGVSKAKAAARLLDDVEYDDATDEPKNLEAAITAAKAEFGDEMFKGSKPAPPGNVNGGSGNEDDETPELTADELAMAKSFGMTPQEYEAAKSPSYRPPEPVKT
jgi:membrane protein involved in colicin uptake